MMSCSPRTSIFSSPIVIIPMSDTSSFRSAPRDKRKNDRNKVFSAESIPLREADPALFRDCGRFFLIPPSHRVSDNRPSCKLYRQRKDMFSASADNKDRRYSLRFVKLARTVGKRRDRSRFFISSFIMRSRIMKLVALLSSSIRRSFAPQSTASIMFAACEVEPEA